MDIPGISLDDSPYGRGATAPPPGELDKEAFLQLLVAQLQNQDPLEPTPNDQFIAQLANFSSLEQMELVNENLVAMVVLQQSNALMEQLTQSSLLIGQTVVFQDPLVGNLQTGVVDSVKVADGLAVLSVGGREVPLTHVTEVSAKSDD